LQWNLHLKIINLHFPTPEFPGILRAKNVRSLLYPIVRSPKPAVFAVEPAPQDHQLTFSNTRIPRNPKGKMHKGIARQHVQKNVQSTKKEHQNTYNTRISRESQGPKM